MLQSVFERFVLLGLIMGLLFFGWLDRQVFLRVLKPFEELVHTQSGVLKDLLEYNEALKKDNKAWHYKNYQEGKSGNPKEEVKRK